MKWRGRRFGLRFGVVAIGLLLALSASAMRISLGDCRDYSAENASLAPSIVRDYLSEVFSSTVMACDAPNRSTYFEFTRPTKYGDVCVAAQYQLLLVGNPSHLARSSQAFTNAELMAVAQFDCPSTGNGEYASVEGVSAEEFERLLATWASSTSTGEAFDDAFSFVSPSSQFADGAGRLRVAVENAIPLKVSSVYRRYDLLVWSRYELDVPEPAARSNEWVVRISCWFGRFCAVSGLSFAVI